MTPELMGEVAEYFRALGEPTRLQLLQALRSGERSVTELVELTGLGQANVSKHLHQLLDCGYVTRRKEGTFVYYSIANDDIFTLCDFMCGWIEDGFKAKRAALKIVR
jgi:DNA-binding transcriptional ArsR family regulator